jgi:DNA uptake protein ComE-like DNA-binding protein
MRTPTILAAATLAALALGCTDSPRSQEQVRHETAAATATVASDLKGAALGIRDGLHKTVDGKPSPDTPAEKVNINTASRLTLMTLPGITAAEAGQIVNHRPYRSTADLLRKHILTKDEYAQASPRLTTSE